ncbi:alpha/beta hydrolase [Skermania sp. ID1734]|uniref:alpha/beta fold hydrolase n=1 Tax=Skermania sp. ID1734 TaxID=2597516 RepID=UPI00117CDF55|nr:alpha/beta fold hydrolase [Skermania sp. ID1734]TSE01108.1 alpha/beta hydrolase [Skermania sp. ID1734]
MNTETARGLRFHVQQIPPAQPGSGIGVPIVFLHGLAVDDLSSFYFTLASPLARAGAEAILYDQRGQGLSDRPPTGYAIADAVADLFAVLDALAVDRPVVLVGNSFGGMVAGYAALARPERVAGLVFVESTCAGPVAEDWLESMVNSLSVAALLLEHERTHEQCGAAGLRKAAKKLTGMHRLLETTSIIEDLAAEVPLPAERLAELSCPVLGVYGEHSFLLPAADDLRRYVRDCRIEVLPDENHSVLGQATGVLCDIVVDWLARSVTLAEAR